MSLTLIEVNLKKKFIVNQCLGDTEGLLRKGQGQHELYRVTVSKTEYLSNEQIISFPPLLLWVHTWLSEFYSVFFFRFH